MTKEEWIAAYVGYTLRNCGFTAFDDGTDVATYATETAETYYADAAYRDDGPDVCAESDMDYWGEA